MVGLALGPLRHQPTHPWLSILDALELEAARIWRCPCLISHSHRGEATRNSGRLAAPFADPAVKALSVLGSTGSIGTQTLEIVEDFPDRFRVVALTAGNNLDLLISQIQRHAPEVVALANAERVAELRPAARRA